MRDFIISFPQYEKHWLVHWVVQIFHKFIYFKKSYLLNPLMSSKMSLSIYWESCQPHSDRCKFSKNSKFCLKTQTLSPATNNAQLFSLKRQVHFVEKWLPNTQVGIITVCQATPLSRENGSPWKKQLVRPGTPSISAAPKEGHTRAAIEAL